MTQNDIEETRNNFILTINNEQQNASNINENNFYKVITPKKINLVMGQK